MSFWKSTSSLSKASEPDDDIDARIAAMEKTVQAVKETVGSIAVDVKEIKEMLR